jgi:1,5-anhydro-D-fructose reductase (1,5-anhydro-D-mannitol-forming)
MERVRWGIIGCGDVTEVKSGPGFQKAEGSALAAVTRRSPGKAEDYARRHGVPRAHESAQALIDDPEVDAVYIATPPGAHLALALAVAAAGKPAYVEKPMARSFEECRRMNEAFAAAGAPLFVAYYRRGLPRFVAAKELIEGGRLGTITAVRVRHAHRRWEGPEGELPWRLRAEHAGGGLFLDLGCHTLDLLDFLLGPLASVSGIAANLASPYAVEDTVSMCFRTQGGALGAALWSFAAHAREDLIEITGTEGTLRMSTFGDEPIEVHGGGGAQAIARPNPPHVQQPLIQSIVDQLLGRGACPSTGASAARTSRVMDEVLAGYYGGRGDAFWERPATWPGRRGREQD